MAAEDGDALIRLVGVTKRYGGRAVLDDVSLDVVARTLVAVVGPSGAGKTTLLNLLLGWEAPDAGSVVRGPSVVPGGDGLVPWRSVAVVPQQRGLVADLSLLENVELPLRLGGAPDRARARGALDRLGVAHLAARLPHQVSLGEQQRASVARALVLRPALVLADEPTAHQDAAAAGLVLDALREASDGGAACVMVTHDPTARDRADEVVAMALGRLTTSRRSAGGGGRAQVRPAGNGGEAGRGHS